MNPPKSPIKPPHLTLAEGRVLFASNTRSNSPETKILTSTDRPLAIHAGDSKNLSSAERLCYSPAMAFLLFR